jgi:ribosomal protein S6--L-glutamate ligase
MIARGTRELKAGYSKLNANDIFIGTVASKYLDQAIMIDLMERGIVCLPSAISQALTRSKVTQARLLNKWMHPLTRVITRRIDLLDAINDYNKVGVGHVVTKEDHKHCGHGIYRWDSIETLYSCMGLNEHLYPFVLQPYMEHFTDIRVIVCGDYTEAYQRKNPHNFRSNLAVGGKTQPHQLSYKEQNFCLDIMKRGKFPYAHIDVLVLDDGGMYLSEIALNGGTKGAMIDQKDLNQKKKDILECLAFTISNSKQEMK